eukprot:TRINITY_DN900_c0_g6_i2.p1 TRINITY_DN900_c0_g6~~TRINITY_DN900_c0_g6_i2.p1  ORF type:complete len:290 (+),score=83.17 TRINITY_DN900_c0_g6_i2:1259-2128(+)
MAHSEPELQPETSVEEEPKEDPEFDIDEILDKRFNPINSKEEFLIKWSGFDSRFNTWEPRENLLCAEILSEFEASLSCLSSSSTTIKPPSSPPKPAPKKRGRKRKKTSGTQDAEWVGDPISHVKNKTLYRSVEKDHIQYRLGDLVLFHTSTNWEDGSLPVPAGVQDGRIGIMKVAEFYEDRSNQKFGRGYRMYRPDQIQLADGSPFTWLESELFLSNGPVSCPVSCLCGKAPVYSPSNFLSLSPSSKLRSFQCHQIFNVQKRFFLPINFDLWTEKLPQVVWLSSRQALI